MGGRSRFMEIISIRTSNNLDTSTSFLDVGNQGTAYKIQYLHLKDIGTDIP